MTKVVLRADCEDAFALWQARFSRVATLATGFLSLELIPTFAGAAEWRIIQRFQSTELRDRWQASSTRQELLAQLKPLSAEAGGEPLDELAPDFHALSCITEVVTTQVEPGREEAFQRWAERIQARQSLFPGYMGTLIQAPISPELPYWTTLVRFSTPEQLEAWLASPERRTLLEESDPQISRWKSQRLNSPFGGWFPTEPDQPQVPAWKQSCLVLLVLFPIVMIELRFLSPLLVHLPGPVATFIGNAISVALVSWPLMKLAIWLLGWWLKPGAKHRPRAETLGIMALLALYLVEILFFLAVY